MYLGHDITVYNPYRFIVTHPSKGKIFISYINEHSREWTESAIQKNILMPIMIMPNLLLFDIQSCITNVTKLHEIAESNNLPDELEKYIKTIMGYSHRLDVTN